MPIDRNIHKKNGFIIVLMAVMGIFTSCTDDTGIEAPRPGDREYYAEEDLAYLKSILTVY